MGLSLAMIRTQYYHISTETIQCNVVIAVLGRCDAGFCAAHVSGRMPPTTATASARDGSTGVCLNPTAHQLDHQRRLSKQHIPLSTTAD